jgi:hypothetical protein
MNVLAKLKRMCWALESEFFGGLSNFTQIFEARVLQTLIPSHRQNKQRSNCEATEMMARKVHVCINNWDFHLVTPPKCQKLPSSITKTAHVKFRATSSSLPTTL